MSTGDERELLWWRRAFACRFPAGNLPQVGTPLHGHHLRIQVQDPLTEEWSSWQPPAAPGQ